MGTAVCPMPWQHHWPTYVWLDPLVTGCTAVTSNSCLACVNDGARGSHVSVTAGLHRLQATARWELQVAVPDACTTELMLL